MLKHLRGVFKRPQSVNDLASQSNLTQRFVSSAFGDHDPVLGNEVGSTEPTTSSKHIYSILILSTTTWPLSR